MEGEQLKPIPGNFLPNLCSSGPVLALVLVGELLALVLVQASSGLRDLNWPMLSSVSFLVQWIVLSSAGLLCLLRPVFLGLPAWFAGCLAYSLVLFDTAFSTVFAQYLLQGQFAPVAAKPFMLDYWNLLENLFIAAVFAGIALRYLYLQQQLSNQQQAELSARIQALQARIRPHFLFNSMNSIASLIDSDPELAEQVVEDLSELFRFSLAEPGMIALKDELEIGRRYLAIEQLRLGERLTVHWDLPEGDIEGEIPSLLLQPLLENAIYHGVQPLPDGGEIAVQLRYTHTHCTLTISNPVASQAKVDGSASLTGNKLALANIRHRLAAHYGSNAQLGLESGLDKYTVELTLPLPEVARP